MRHPTVIIPKAVEHSEDTSQSNKIIEGIPNCPLYVILFYYKAVLTWNDDASAETGDVVGGSADSDTFINRIRLQRKVGGENWEDVNESTGWGLKEHNSVLMDDHPLDQLYGQWLDNTSAEDTGVVTHSGSFGFLVKRDTRDGEYRIKVELNKPTTVFGATGPTGLTSIAFELTPEFISTHIINGNCKVLLSEEDSKATHKVDVEGRRVKAIHFKPSTGTETSLKVYPKGKKGNPFYELDADALDACVAHATAKIGAASGYLHEVERESPAEDGDNTVEIKVSAAGTGSVYIATEDA